MRRRVGGVLQYAIMLPFSVEIYRIIELSGALVTSELLNLPFANPIGDDIVRTEHVIEVGTARQVKAGDVLVLQPGTPHWFGQIDGESIAYHGIQSKDHHRTSPVSVILTESPERARDAARRRTAVSSFLKPA